MSFFEPNIKRFAAKRDVDGLIIALDYSTELTKKSYFAFQKFMRSASVREEAAKALGSLGDAKAVEPLILAMKKDGSPLVRAAAAESLGILKDKRAVEPLISALNTRENHHAAEFLYGEDHYAELIRAVISALGMLGDERAAVHLRTFLTRGCYVFRDSLKDSLRIDAAVALVKIGDEKSIDQAWEACSDMLKYTYSMPRIFDVLVNIGGSRALNPILEKFMDARRYGNLDWSAYVDTLVEFGTKSTAPLVLALRNWHALIRSLIADALEKMHWQPDNEEDAAWFCIARQDWDGCLKMGASAVGPLFTLFEMRVSREFKEDYIARAGALRTLAALCDPKTLDPQIDLLLNRLSRDDAFGRRDAVEDLGNLGSTRAVEPLIWRLNDTWIVRAAAGEALVNIYRYGKLNREAKEKILSVRPIIIAPQLSEADRLRMETGELKPGELPDGLGIDFPL